LLYRLHLTTVSARIFAQKKGEKLNEGQQLVRDARKTHAREFRATCRDEQADDLLQQQQQHRCKTTMASH